MHITSKALCLFALALCLFAVSASAEGITITTTSPLAQATAGTAYAQSFTATGGKEPYTWAITGGTLPPGLALSPGGVLTGIPTVAADYSFIVSVADSASANATVAFEMTVLQANSSNYFVMTTAGWGPQVGASGAVSVGIGVAKNVYAITTLDVAGGVGAVTEDVAYRVACTAGVCLYGSAGAGMSTTNGTASTSYTPTFAGGGMVTYDASKLWKKLAHFEFVGQVKIAYGSYTTTADGLTETGTAVKPQYRLGLKFNWGN
jgi:hypothetical protein